MLTPDDIMSGAAPEGPVLVYDDDHYYMGGVIAEKLRGDGVVVTLATPDPVVSSWTTLTLEQHRIQARLIELGIGIETNTRLVNVGNGVATLACVFTGRHREVAASSIVMVTSRLPNDALYRDLAGDTERLREAGIASLHRIGDCHGPATIAAAVYEGHRFARELGTEPADIPFKRELTELSTDFVLP